MKFVLSHPGVPPFVQQAALALNNRDWLEAFHTSFAYRPHTAFGTLLRHAYGLVRPDADAQLRRRIVTSLPDQRLSTHPTWEMLRVIASRIGGDVVGDRVWEFTESAFDVSVATQLTDKLTHVYGYEHSSLATFNRAKELGLRIFYDMPAPHHRTTTKVLDQEYSAWPELITDHYRHTRSKTPRRDARRDAELHLADYVVCASDLTANSLLEAGIAAAKILKVPYGMPVPSTKGTKTNSGPLRFLYAGTLSARKGAHYLIQACKRITFPAGVELWMVGANSLPLSLLSGLPAAVRIQPSVPRSALFQLYHDADLLLFPTLLDGFGMVLTEALSCGLPVLTTNQAGSAEFIQDKVNGFVVPAGDADAIASALDWSLRHPQELRAMRPNCVAAAAAWQWDDYRALFTERMDSCSAQE